MAVAYLGLGSNLGNRRIIMDRAVKKLNSHKQVQVLAVAGYIETDPVGYLNQGRFLNSAVAVETSLAPHELLNAVQDVERHFGRERLIRWGPRTLDIDILLYDDIVLNTAELTIPHPRLVEREFVLVPLAEIAPDVVVPTTDRTVKELLYNLQTGGDNHAVND